MYNILIVDDQVVDIMELEEALAVRGNNFVGVAYSDKTAIKMALQLQPNLILMDIKMPGEVEDVRLLK